MNTLYYGDNLDVLRRYIKDESVDLIYLDPPFKSNQDYNVLFKEESGTRAAAQILAFEDTWHWDQSASAAYEEVVLKGGKVSQVMQAFRTFLGTNDMLAYLAMMAPRLVELRRVLKPTGSIYLHCDPTASHYLKLLMDAVFGVENLRNEIVWKRSQPKSHTKIRMSRAHDVILFYAKSAKAVYSQQYVEHDPAYLEKFYKYVEPKTGRRYTLDNLANPNKNRPNLTYEFPPKSGTVRVWRWTKDRMMKAWKEKRIIVPKEGGVARYKRYLDEMEGTPVTDWWDNIEHLHGTSRGPDIKSEGLGYPTQKPEALLERIIQGSSSKGEIVLDPFCGCGTAVAVAQRLNRQWIGIDITHLAITLIKKRLVDGFGRYIKFKVVGEPTVFEDAKQLAEDDKFQFQLWALGLVNARPAELKKGADLGIDGRIYFVEGKDRHHEQVIFSVKGGHLKAVDVRDLVAVVQREKAAIGVLITMGSPTKQMRTEAAAAGFYHSDWQNTMHPKIQILTIEELLQGNQIDLPRTAFMPASDATFKKAPKSKKKDNGNGEMFE